MQRPFYSGLCIALLALSLIVSPSLADDSRQFRIAKDGRLLRLHISNSFGSDRQLELRLWIERLANSLAQVYGHWPQREWAVSIEPTEAGGNDPIPWARIRRDAPPKVEFYILPNATTAELARAWTAYHEIAHLLIPYRGWGEAWFSEGLASYYQNLLQARAKVLTQEQMWQKLHDGFQRGQEDTAPAKQSLRELSQDFRRQGRFMRVYWSGAWYFLELDKQLRQQSGGQLTLDLALAKLNECCSSQSMSVAEMVTALDEINGVSLFEPLYTQLRESTSTPDHLPVFSALGITVENGRVVLGEQGPGAALRDSIYRGHPL